MPPSPLTLNLVKKTMTHSHFNKKIFAIGLWLFLVTNFLAITAVYAAPYVPLAPLPGTTEIVDGKEVVANAGNYIKGAFNLAIGIAAALAIIMIILGGIQYMGSESLGGKSAGRKRINDAVLGLLLALGSYLILFTINPSLVDFNVNIGAITPPTAPTVTQPTTGLYYFYYTTNNLTAREATVTKGPYSTLPSCERERTNIQAAATANYYRNITNCQDKNYLTDYIPAAPTGYLSPQVPLGTTLSCFTIRPRLEPSLTSRRFCYTTPELCRIGVSEIGLREREKGGTILDCSPVTI